MTYPSLYHAHFATGLGAVDGEQLRIPLGSEDYKKSEDTLIVGRFNKIADNIGGIVRRSHTEHDDGNKGNEGVESVQGHSNITLPFESVKDNFLIHPTFYIEYSGKNSLLYGFGDKLFYWDAYAYTIIDEMEKNIIDEKMLSHTRILDLDAVLIQESSDGSLYFEISYQENVYVIASRRKIESVKVVEYFAFVRDHIDDNSMIDYDLIDLVENNNDDDGVLVMSNSEKNGKKQIVTYLYLLPIFKLKENPFFNELRIFQGTGTDIHVFKHVKQQASVEDSVLYRYDPKYDEYMNRDIVHRAYVSKILNDVVIDHLDILEGEILKVLEGKREYSQVFLSFSHDGKDYIVEKAYLIEVKKVILSLEDDVKNDLSRTPIMYQIQDPFDFSHSPTSLYISLPLRLLRTGEIGSETGDENRIPISVTNKEFFIFYLLGDKLYSWPERPVNSLEKYQYMRTGYLNDFLVKFLDIDENHILTEDVRVEGLIVRKKRKEEIESDVLVHIEFKIDNDMYLFELAMHVFHLSRRELIISRDPQNNTYFSFDNQLLTTIVTYDIKLITDIEFTNIVKNSNTIVDEQTFNAAPLVWCPAILFNGFIQLEPSNFDAFVLLDELNRNFEQAVSILLTLESGNITFQFPFIDGNNIIAQKATVLGDVSKSGQLKLVTGSEYTHFMLDLKESSMRDILGFSIAKALNRENRFKLMPRYQRNSHTIESVVRMPNEFGIRRRNEGFEIMPPGVINLLGVRYVILRCPEIESLIGTHSFDSSTPGIGVFVLGLNQQTIKQRLDFVHYVRKPFHPIEKLHKLTFRFEVKDGTPYDFKGIDMFMILQINTYAPVKKVEFDHKQSILQPNYNPNFIQYTIDEDRKAEAQFNYTQNSMENEEEYDSEEANEVVQIQNQYDPDSEEDFDRNKNENGYDVDSFDARDIRII